MNNNDEQYLNELHCLSLGATHFFGEMLRDRLHNIAGQVEKLQDDMFLNGFDMTSPSSKPIREGLKAVANSIEEMNLELKKIGL